MAAGRAEAAFTIENASESGTHCNCNMIQIATTQTKAQRWVSVDRESCSPQLGSVQMGKRANRAKLMTQLTNSQRSAETHHCG